MNTLPPLPLKDGCLFIDTSTLELYTTCARSYEYGALHKRRLAETKMALIFGTAIHGAMESRYHGGSLAHQIAAGKRLLEGVAADVSDHRTPEFLEQVIKAYDLEYMDEPFFIVKDNNGKSFVEHSFAVPLGTVVSRNHGDIRIVYTGRIDLAIEMDGALMPLDHKTTSMMGAKYFDEFTNGQQPIGYAWALQQLLKREVGGYFINAIVCRKPTKTGTAIEFARQRYYLEQDRMVEWRENTLWLAQRIINDYDAGYYPMETKWCVGKYGLCPYFQVCSLPRSGRESLLNSRLYETNTWSPLD